MVFLDHTPLLFPTDSIDLARLESNVLGLATIARELGMPVAISTICSKQTALSDGLFRTYQGARTLNVPRLR